MENKEVKDLGISDKERIKQFFIEQQYSVHAIVQGMHLHGDILPATRGGNWSSVLDMGEAISKQATLVGTLCTGDTPKVEALEDSIKICYNLLKSLILFSHGSTMGAGYTLFSCLRGSFTQIFDTTCTLAKECVDSYGSSDENLLIPVLVDKVRDASSALKNTPTKNVTAIAQAITRVIMSMKDVLQEIELKSTATLVDEAIDLVVVVPEKTAPEDVEENMTNDIDNYYHGGGNAGKDLLEEEMLIAQSTAEFISETIVVVNNLVRSIIGLHSRESKDALPQDTVVSLEKMLQFCQKLGTEVEELGTCISPPLTIHVMKVVLGNISSIIDNVQAELKTLGCSADDFFQSCNSLRDSIRMLECEMDSSNLMEKIE